MLLLLHHSKYTLLSNNYFHHHNKYFNTILNIFLWSCFHHIGTRVFVQAFLSVVIINSTTLSELNHVGAPECNGSMYPLVGCSIVVKFFFFIGTFLPVKKRTVFIDIICRNHLELVILFFIFHSILNTCF